MKKEDRVIFSGQHGLCACSVVICALAGWKAPVPVI